VAGPGSRSRWRACGEEFTATSSRPAVPHASRHEINHRYGESPEPAPAALALTARERGRVCPDGQRAPYAENPGGRAGPAGARLLGLLQRAGRLPAGRLVHYFRLAAPGVQADSLRHEPGADHRRGDRALPAVRPPARRGRRPVRPQAPHARQRHRPGARHHRNPGPGDRRATAGRGHLRRGLRAVDARDHLQLRRIRGHPRTRRRTGTGHGQRPRHGGKQRWPGPRPRAGRRARGLHARSRPPVRGRRLLSRLVGLPRPDPVQLQRGHPGHAAHWPGGGGGGGRGGGGGGGGGGRSGP
jgi:translation initiation factor IF-2